MRKIPTLFERDPNDRRRVLPIVTEGCEWVLAGDGVATRKYDGTCVLVRRDGLAVKGYARREVKPGKSPPPNFVEVDSDDETGKVVGWEPIDQSGFAAFFDEAVTGLEVPGTYELCGPKINGNPEGLLRHVLVPHGADDLDFYPLSFESLREWVLSMSHEGVVWWREPGNADAGLAKLKRRDFGR